MGVELSTEADDHHGHHAMGHGSMPNGSDHDAHAGHDMMGSGAMPGGSGGMDHSGHGAMDHSGHGAMDHSGHGAMDHSAHAGHGAAMAVGTIPDHGGGHGAHGGGHSMAMSFHFGYNETILFDWWTINSAGGLVASFFGIMLLAALYEVLKYYRERFYQWSLARCRCKPRKARAAAGGSLSPKGGIKPSPSGASDALVLQETGSSPCCANGDDVKILSSPSVGPDEVRLAGPDSPWTWHHAAHTALHALQFVHAYLLMLIFMTYNVWLCLAVVLGIALGFGAVGWKRRTPVIEQEHCC